MLRRRGCPPLPRLRPAGPRRQQARQQAPAPTPPPQQQLPPQAPAVRYTRVCGRQVGSLCMYLSPCDVCSFIFCLEDRALLCRNCDVPIHAPNTLAASHQRFLATGVKVALDAEQASVNLPVHKPEAPRPPQPPTNRYAEITTSSTIIPVDPPRIKESENKPSNVSMAYPQGCIPESLKRSEEWKAAEVLNLPDLAAGYTLGDIMSSKADLAPLISDNDWMTDLSIFDEHIYAGSLAEVPQISPMSTGFPQPGRIDAGLKVKCKQNVGLVPGFDDVSVVPDLGLYADHIPPLKWRKMFPGVQRLATITMP